MWRTSYWKELIIKDTILLGGYNLVDFVGKGDTESKKAYLIPKKDIEKSALKVIKLNDQIHR